MNVIKNIVKIILVVIISSLLFSSVTYAADTIPYPTYTIDSSYIESDSPATYVPLDIVSGGGAGNFMDPVDMQVYKGVIYVLDSGSNSVFVMDSDFKIIKIIDSFIVDGTSSTFNKPQGLTISSTGELYVADTDNSRIIKFDQDYSAVKIFSRPDIAVLGTDFVYKPLKIGVDSSKRIYVIAQGVNRGLVELNSDGQFMSFLGAPKVTYNLFSYLWKRILTKDQAKYLEKFVPTEFSNLRIDYDGFIFTTIKANDYEKVFNAVKTHDGVSIKAVEKFSASGIDILRRFGDIPIVGDVNFQITAAEDGSGKGKSTSPIYNPSSFEDIAVDEVGTYYCLDSKRSRVFTYDIDGNLLYAFGNSGNQTGNFITPVAIDCLGEKLLVLDKSLKRITVFGRTEYGRNLHSASKFYSDGLYKESLELWSNVSKFNANLSFAYIGMGKCYYYLHDFENAIKYLKLADEKKYCSKAYEKYRVQQMVLYFKPAISILLVIIAILATIIIISKRRKKKVALDKKGETANEE